MGPETPTARQLTRRLIAREAAESDSPDVAVAAAHAAGERLFRELARWLGATGCHALFTRALAHARSTHPALAEVSVEHRSAPTLEGVAESVRAHGAAAVAAGLESLLVALLELLGRLIGDDMAARLVEPSAPIHSRHDESLE